MIFLSFFMNFALFSPYLNVISRFDTQEYTYRQIADIFRALGMPFTGHILRHTFITNAYEFGFPQYLVQRWVGHASFDEDNIYLSLRTASTYCETEVTAYMRLLKKMTVLDVCQKQI